MIAHTTTTVLEYFAAQNHIRLKREWLECAVRYLSSSGANKSCYNGLIFEQWLYSDIGESTLPCLKDALKDSKLNGVFVLQVVSVLDVQFSESTYQTSGEAKFQCEDEVASDRVQIILSDGRDEVKAVEHKPIPYLSALLRPGCKILLHGTIPIVRNLFFLEPNNCQVLGGDVEIQPTVVSTQMFSIDDFAGFFARFHIRLKREWLECAVKYLFLYGANKSCCNNLIFEQWLYSDIGESTLPCLKDVLRGRKLDGVFVLQVISVLDVGSPLLGQFNKLTYETNDNAEFQCEGEGQNTTLSVSSRCLRLTLSDGSAEIRALEYRPAPQLSLFMCPGCKILLFGSIRLRCGHLLLEPNNFHLLGGDVVSLMVTNRPVEVMSRKLGKPVPILKKA